MNRIEVVVEGLKTRVRSVVAEIDAPNDPSGAWFLDARVGKNALVIEWRPGLGFGLSSVRPSGHRADGYGDEAPDEFFAYAEDVLERAIELLTTGAQTQPPSVINLRGLRERKFVTQGELAGILGVRQATISKLERRGEDTTIEALRSLVRALGGDLEVSVRIGERVVPMVFGSDADPELQRIVRAMQESGVRAELIRDASECARVDGEVFELLEDWFRAKDDDGERDEIV